MLSGSGEEPERRSQRGPHWLSDHLATRATYRYSLEPYKANTITGFRLVWQP